VLYEILSKIKAIGASIWGYENMKKQKYRKKQFNVVKGGFSSD
jgi:hypothetical protein